MEKVMKKILVHTYDTAFQNKSGGVRNRILRIVDFLREEGVEVDFFNKYKTKIEEYDVLHIFMLKSENYSLIKYAKSKGLKVVISSIVTLSGKTQLKLYWKIRRLPIMTTYKILFNCCDLADEIIVETKKEAFFLNKYYHVPKSKIKLIPNGADFIKSNSRIIFDFLAKKCKYALEVGRFDKNKNQLNVIKALKNTKIEVVFIGGADPFDKEYYDECLNEAKDSTNIHFLGWLDREDELLASAYCNAELIISSSYYETFGLTIVEGVMAGLTPVISNRLPILDFSAFENCVTFDPSNIQDINEKIRFSMNTRSLDASIKLSKKVKNDFSWKKVAIKHIEVYEE